MAWDDYPFKLVFALCRYFGSAGRITCAVVLLFPLPPSRQLTVHFFSSKLPLVTPGEV